MVIIEESFQALAEQLDKAEANEKKLEALQAQFDQTQKMLEHERQSKAQQIKLVQERDKQLEESEQESGLLLLQLHQVQEELEIIFLKHKASESTLEKNQQELGLLNKTKPGKKSNKSNWLQTTRKTGAGNQNGK